FPSQEIEKNDIRNTQALPVLPDLANGIHTPHGIWQEGWQQSFSTAASCEAIPSRLKVKSPCSGALERTSFATSSASSVRAFLIFTGSMGGASRWGTPLSRKAQATSPSASAKARLGRPAPIYSSHFPST